MKTFYLLLIHSISFVLQTQAQTNLTQEQINDSLNYFPLNVGNNWFYNGPLNFHLEISDNLETIDSVIYREIVISNLWDYAYSDFIYTDSVSGNYILYPTSPLSYLNHVRELTGYFLDGEYNKPFIFENFVVNDTTTHPFLNNTLPFNESSFVLKSLPYYKRTYWKSDRELAFENPTDTLFKIKEFETRLQYADSPNREKIIWYGYVHNLGLLYSYRNEVIRKSDGSADTLNGYFYEEHLFKATVNGRFFNRPSKYPTSIEHHKLSEKPNSIEISNHPNPFNPTTTFTIKSTSVQYIRLDIITLLGQHVTTLLNERVHSGVQQVPFSAEALPSGTYLWRLTSEHEVQTGKITLVK